MEGPPPPIWLAAAPRLPTASFRVRSTRGYGRSICTECDHATDRKGEEREAARLVDDEEQRDCDRRERFQDELRLSKSTEKRSADPKVPLFG